MTSSSDLPTIPEWFRGSRVLITGGSGFMGKVLVEKLLRSCPEVDTIYLLLRPKKGKQPSSRIQDITDIPLFHKLRKKSPNAFSKLVAVSGDVKELGLGLSDADRRLLQQQVDVVFHSAASVRFDDPIRDAVLINVRGTREVLDLALGMDKLKVLLHVSTTYCNRDTPKVLEKLYPAPADWRTMISLVEESDKDDTILRCLTPKILADAPNTYTFAKALGEQVVNDYKDKLPLVIVRPSIVMTSAVEPMPGWIDNFNGPTGLFMGVWVGMLRSWFGDKDNCYDIVPVDVAIKSIIYIAWHRALVSSAQTLPVYNCAAMVSPMRIQEFHRRAFLVNKKYPMTMTVWYPPTNVLYTQSKFVYFLAFTFLQLLPAKIMDTMLSTIGKKPILMNIQRKIFIATKAIKFFIVTTVSTDNSLFLGVQSAMLPSDKADFAYEVISLGESDDASGYMKKGIVGARIYLMRDPLSTLPQARRHFNRLYWLDRAFKVVMACLGLWVVGGFNFIINTLPEQLALMQSSLGS